MKKNYGLFKQAHIELLENWLRIEPEYRCSDCPVGDCSICSNFFPRCRGGGCPCNVYTTSYLEGQAKKITEYLKEKYHD